MHASRHDSRVPGGGLTACVEEPTHGLSWHAVIDISEGGLHLARLSLPVGSQITFDIEGVELRCHGSGHVVRSSDGSVAVAVDQWSESADSVLALVTAGLLADMEWRELYVSNWP